MVKVPEYQGYVQARPAYRQGIDVQATPEAFGAGIGRGMQAVGQGMDQAATALAQVQQLQDLNRAKDAENDYSNWLRERMYGNNGYMTLEGRNAVEGRKAFEAEAEQKRKEFGAGLTPGAARAYQDASRARINSAYQTSIVHSAQANKDWFKDASDARIQTFADDALTGYQNPATVQKNIAAGVMELRERGGMMGWDQDTLKAREEQYISGIHKNVALRIAQTDPLAAQKYAKENNKSLSGKDMTDLDGVFAPLVVEEQGKQEADRILGLGRGGASSSAAPAGGSPIPSSRSAGQAGPTKARSFLYGVLTGGKNKQHIDGLDNSFATNLAAMIQDAPPGIKEGLGVYSGFRSEERQAELWQGALKKYGSAEAARKWVAPPGRSNHNHGQAVDLAFNGQSLSRAPQNVVDWVHANAGKYGLYFPLSNENWHIEPLGTRGTKAPEGSAMALSVNPNDMERGTFGRAGTGDVIASSFNGVSKRSQMPSPMDINAALEGITNPNVRDATLKRITTIMTLLDKQQKADMEALKSQAFSVIDAGNSPDNIPAMVRAQLGREEMSGLWSYYEARAKGNVQTDDRTLYDLQTLYAQNPAAFGEMDLFKYRSKLSNSDWDKVTGWRQTALTDQRKAKEDGVQIGSAMTLATNQLEAVGITTTGKKGDARQKEAERIAQFQMALMAQMDEFTRANENKKPTDQDIQAMVNRLLLPIVIKEERSIWNPLKTPWSSHSEKNAFAFEAQKRPDGSLVEVQVKYADIPIDLRRGISTDLERELGRKPSEEEVVSRYETFILNQ